MASTVSSGTFSELLLTKVKLDLLGSRVRELSDATTYTRSWRQGPTLPPTQDPRRPPPAHSKGAQRCGVMPWHDTAHSPAGAAVPGVSGQGTVQGTPGPRCPRGLGHPRAAGQRSTCGSQVPGRQGRGRQAWQGRARQGREGPAGRFSSRSQAAERAAVAEVRPALLGRSDGRPDERPDGGHGGGRSLTWPGGIRGAGVAATGAGQRREARRRSAAPATATDPHRDGRC